jgi:nucleotide-binding universal stress UspA family protein
MSPIRSILYPTDFSPQSSPAFAVAAALARDYGARLVVLHVAIPPPFVTYGEFYKALEDPQGYRLELEKKLREYQVPNAAGGVEYRLEQGDPTVEIVRLAERLPGDLIVLGTHGRTGVSRLLMGSVAEEVVRQAPCPVITVRAPRRAVPVSEEAQADCLSTGP